MTETAVAKTPNAMEAFRGILEVQKQAIAQILPRTLTPERMIKLMIVAASRNPKLLECSKESLLLAFMNAVELGLEPNSPLQMCFIIPYRNNKTGKTEAQFQIGWRGLLALVRRSDEVASIDAYVVRQKDAFDVEFGDDARIVHRPEINEDPGPTVAVYATAVLKSGQREREVMTKAEVEKIRKRSKAADAGPWVTDWDEMARKTVLKRICKRLPIRIEVAEVIDRENEEEYGALDVVSSLPPMPTEAAPTPADETPQDQGTPEIPTERTIEDEIYELGAALELPEADTAKRIKTMSAAGKLDTLRDNYKLELKKKKG